MTHIEQSYRPRLIKFSGQAATTRLIHQSAWKVNSPKFILPEGEAGSQGPEPMPPLYSSYHGLGCKKHARYVRSRRRSRIATCLPTRLGLASHPTKVPLGRNALPNKRREEGVKAYGADPRARPSPLREPRNAVRYCLRVASGLRRSRVRLRPEGDP